jgi:hypothetical protein
MNKKLLISGCSYGVIYSEIQNELKEIFGIDEVINLSQNGGSPSRSIRGAIEWIAQNGNPHMIILPISHYNRFDLPIAERIDPIHNKHFRSTWQMDISKNYGSATPIDPKFDKDTLQTYLKTGTLIHENEYPVHDDLFVKLITFQAFLELHKIKHIIFDTGNYYEKLWNEKQTGMTKRNIIENSKGIYKLFSFCSNVWMYNQLTDKEKINYIPWWKPQGTKPLGKIVPDTVAATIHHQKEQVVKLMQFLKKEGAVHG